MIEQRKLKDLIKLMVENDLTELDLQSEGERVCLKRSQDQPQVQLVPATPAQPAAAPAAPAEAASDSTINSPMVGTFYITPSPDAKPFVQAGSQVTPDTVVCLIEAMKVFNEIKADAAGTIQKMLVDNGQAVEFDQPLFQIKPQ